MKNVEEVAHSPNQKTKNDPLDAKLDEHQNYTDRGEKFEKKKWVDGLKYDFEGKAKHRSIINKTRNDFRRGHKGNQNNYSSSSIFSLSHDDTLRSHSNKSTVLFIIL
jgi:hypothetical protein